MVKTESMPVEGTVARVQPDQAVERRRRPGGRPRRYESPEQMQAVVDDYFATVEVLTVSGLAIHLGFAHRKSLLDYARYGDVFCNVVKRALLRIEADYEKGLSKPAAAGSKFALRRMGWSDRQEQVIPSDVGLDALPSDPAEIDRRIAELEETKKRLQHLLPAAEFAGEAVVTPMPPPRR